MRSLSFLSILFCLILMYSCNGIIKNDNKQERKKNIEKERVLALKKGYVIHYYPDSLNREYLISINGEEQYEQVVQDNMEENFRILEYLDSLKIETIVSNDPFFVFENDTIYRNELKNKFFGFILVIKNKPYFINNENYHQQLKKIIF